MSKRIPFLLVGLLGSVLFLLAALYVIKSQASLNPFVPPPRKTFRILQLSPQREVSVWTEEDRVAKMKLSKKLTDGQPVQRLVYDRAKTMDGRVVEERPDSVIFSEQFGDNGEISVTLPRSRIVRIEPLSVPAPEVTLRDVRFFREFPDKRFYKKPPYTLITEESFFSVEQMVNQLQDLYTQVVEWMAPLITVSSRRDDIQLLIFSDAAEYTAYMRRYAPILEGSGGFYHMAKDQLVVLHQRDADWVAQGREEINQTAEKQRGQLKTGNDYRRLSQWKKDSQGRLLTQALEATRNTIRHEGAHQLLFTLGVQNPLQNGHGWVCEGLATFFETVKPGGINLSRRNELKAAEACGQLIPLSRLLALTRCETSLEYAEAWALTCLLMQPEYRTGFFAYLDGLRNHPAPSFGDPEAELCRFLSCSPVELERRWQTFLSTF